MGLGYFFMRRIMGDVRVCFLSKLVEAYIARKTLSPTIDILTELDKSPLLSPGNVIVKACEKCSQREAATRVEFVTLLLKEVSFQWSSIAVTLAFTNVALNQCTTCMLECVLRVHPDFKILSLYLFIYSFICLSFICRV